ncbi:Putative transposase of IS4/5 family [Streptomyces sp. 3213]|nr:Putative transposase of IS4/5 family [Streptomyces sp. 3213] [Streptomyces sp. 3213.3]
MGRDQWSWIVPDRLWAITKPLIPPAGARPQGGGTQDTPDEPLFTTIVYVLVSGCAWRQLPPCFGISKSTAHRRFLIWSRAGIWGACMKPCCTASTTPISSTSPFSSSTPPTSGPKKGGRTHRSEPRRPGQAGFQDARLVGRERTALPSSASRSATPTSCAGPAGRSRRRCRSTSGRGPVHCACGAVHDRGINAARNILAAGGVFLRRRCKTSTGVLPKGAVVGEPGTPSRRPLESPTIRRRRKPTAASCAATGNGSRRSPAFVVKRGLGRATARDSGPNGRWAPGNPCSGRYRHQRVVRAVAVRACRGHQPAGSGVFGKAAGAEPHPVVGVPAGAA